jgi:hypothetical protein
VQGSGAAALLVISIAMRVAGERLADPTRAFVEGCDPSGNDFLANVPSVRCSCAFGPTPTTTVPSLRSRRYSTPFTTGVQRRGARPGFALLTSESVRMVQGGPSTQPFPPYSFGPSQAFLDVWEKNVRTSGFSALPPQPGHL